MWAKDATCGRKRNLRDELRSVSTEIEEVTLVTRMTLIRIATCFWMLTEGDHEEPKWDPHDTDIQANVVFQSAQNAD